MDQAIATRPARLKALHDALATRILVLDGAMGTMVQRYRLTEAEYRGERFRDFAQDLRGNNDLLTLTRPQVIREIHAQYLEAGADILETNTFNSTTISQADYHLESIVEELNLEAARLARAVADEFTAKTPAKPRFVAGVLGPMNRTLSLSPDVNDPGFRAVNFDQVKDAYLEAVAALVEGGADILLVETIFDTLNAKAALFAIDEYFERSGVRLPIMISGTITDASGRTLSGQTPEAFWNSVRHARPLSDRLQLRAGRAGSCARTWRSSRASPTRSSPRTPTRACPTRWRSTTSCRRRPPPSSASGPRPAGSTSPAAAAARRPRTSRPSPRSWRRCKPRVTPKIEPKLRLSGLEPLNIGADSLFVNVGERTNVTGSKAFARLILAGDYAEALSVARQQVENGAQVIDVNMDEAMLDSQAAMTKFLNLVAAEPDISRVPIMIDSSKWSVIEAGLKCVQGKGIVNSISLKEGEAEFVQQAKLARRYGAAVIVMAFDEKGQADTLERKTSICERCYQHPHRAGGLPARGHHLRPEHLRHRHRHRGAQPLRPRLPRGRGVDPPPPAAREDLRRRVQPLVLLPRQRAGARGHAHRVPVPRRQGRHDDGHRERRAARRVRGHPDGPARARRGRDLRPPPGRHRAPGDVRRAASRARRRTRSRTSRGAAPRSRSGSRTRW